MQRTGRKEWRYARVVAGTGPDKPGEAPVIGRIQVSRLPDGPWREATPEEEAEIRRDFPEQLRRFSTQ